MLSLWSHQEEARRRAEPFPYFAFFMEMGTGKTGAAIRSLCDKYNEYGQLMRTLVFCPPIVIQNWRAEWGKFSKVPLSDVIPLVGSGEKRLKTFLANAFNDDDACRLDPNLGTRKRKIFITNYEALVRMPQLHAAFMLWAPEAVAFDESHYLKNPTSKVSKAASMITNGGPMRPKVFLLSGTPVLNSPMDLFQQFLIMDGGARLGRNFWGFRGRFFYDKNSKMPAHRHFPNWQILPGMEAEINRIISEVSIQVKKTDCMDLPPLVQQTIKVGMTPDQARMYKEMKRDFVTTMGDATVSADLAITKGLRLQQIASGYCKTTDGEEISLDKTPKMEALKELLEELTPNHKVLVWAVWKENYAQIRAVCEQLGLPYVEVHGGISAKEKDEAVKRFNEDPLVRVFIGHPGSGGIGINLVVASYSVFFSRTFSLAHSLQAEARNHRGGSLEAGHEKITRIDLVCEGTIDELVQQRLADKFEIGVRLLQDLSRELDEQDRN